MTFLTVLRAIAAVLLILVLAWWSTGFLARKMRGAANGHSMKVIDSITVGRDRQLLLVKIQEETFLIGSSPQGLRFMTKVEGKFDDIPEDEHPQNPGMPFQDALRKVLNQMGAGKGAGKNE